MDVSHNIARFKTPVLLIVCRWSDMDVSETIYGKHY